MCSIELSGSPKLESATYTSVKVLTLMLLLHYRHVSTNELSANEQQPYLINMIHNLILTQSALT